MEVAIPVTIDAAEAAIRVTVDTVVRNRLEIDTVRRPVLPMEERTVVRTRYDRPIGVEFPN